MSKIAACIKKYFFLQTELSQTLQVLSEKLKAGTELLSRLKAMPDKVQVSKASFPDHLHPAAGAKVSGEPHLL